MGFEQAFMLQVCHLSWQQHHGLSPLDLVAQLTDIFRITFSFYNSLSIHIPVMFRAFGTFYTLEITLLYHKFTAQCLKQVPALCV